MTDTVILVPLDGSKSALCALPIARRFADLAKGSVRILHVSEETASPAKTAASLGLQPADLGGAVLEVRAGRPAETILASAADCGARLIVMCARSAGPAGAIGDAALAVLRGAQCPLVLVDPTRAPGGWALRRMLASHDGSPSVSHALKPATELARAAAAELIVLQVASDECPQEVGSIAPPVYLDQVQHSWPGWSKEFLHRLDGICQLVDVPVRLLLAHGEPAEEMVRVAKEESADLIVLAWTGRGDDASTLKGLLRDTPCPVMVTRVRAS